MAETVVQWETEKAQNNLQWFLDKLDRHFDMFFLCDSFYFFDNRKMQIAKRRKRNPLDTIYYSNSLRNFTHIKRTRNRFKFFEVKGHSRSKFFYWLDQKIWKILKFLICENFYFHVNQYGLVGISEIEEVFEILAWRGNSDGFQSHPVQLNYHFWPCRKRLNIRTQISTIFVACSQGCWWLNIGDNFNMLTSIFGLQHPQSGYFTSLDISRNGIFAKKVDILREVDFSQKWIFCKKSILSENVIHSS